MSNEPVIFQTEADVKAKKNSVLGKGQYPAEVELLWILSEMLFHFLKLTTLALLIVPLIAKNLTYLAKTSIYPLGITW